MRAVGASRAFVRSLFIAETMILIARAAALGAALAWILCFLVSLKGIPVHNAMAMTLFGSARLRPMVTPGGLAFDIGAALAVGAIAWIYPVHLALRIEPARAITVE